ncbi:hypothetical protein BKA82DRAFT_4010525 [Pisolithus tinctorius]|nr:hypothetical protein BKA82DRAFT_4010525 [Pisolithus tinctorius]
MSQRWVVFGGKEPGIYQSWSSPPLPLAIECISTDEAELVMQTLKTILGPLLPEPTMQELLDVLSTSLVIRNLLKHSTNDFYAVVVGNPTGIHRTEEAAGPVLMRVQQVTQQQQILSLALYQPGLRLRLAKRVDDQWI